MLFFRPVHCGIPGPAPGSSTRPASLRDCQATDQRSLPDTARSADTAGATVILSSPNASARDVLGPADLTARAVRSVTLVAPAPGSGAALYSVSLRFTAAGAKAFDRIAAMRYAYYAPSGPVPDPRSEEAVDVDGVAVSVPIIEAPSFNGAADISGNFDRARAQRIAHEIRKAAGLAAPGSATTSGSTG